MVTALEEKDSADPLPPFGATPASAIPHAHASAPSTSESSSPPLSPIPSTSSPVKVIAGSSRLRSSLHRLFTRQSTSSISASSKKSLSQNRRRMMTTGQLSDLFRRLDKDGNGELDLEEFTQIVSKLQMDISEEFVIKVFHKVDSSQTGTLKLQEFVSAYQLLFTRPSMIGSHATSKSNFTQKKPTEVICAVRYGTDSTGKYLYEMYLGTVVDLSDGPILTINEKRIYQLLPDENPEDMAYDTIEDYSVNLNELNEMITQDSLNNKAKKTKLFWWIDVAMTKVAAHRVDKYIAGLGLPNDSKFRSAFSQFGTSLTRDEKSHVYMGNGLSTLGGVSSMNMFLQAIRISRIPVTHHLPLWLDYAFETFCPVSVKNSIKDYYFSRFAFFFNSGSSRQSVLVEESRNAVETSQIIANRLAEAEEEFEDMASLRTEERKGNKSMKPTVNLLSPSPLPPRTISKYKSAPTWLLSQSELRKHSPGLKFEDLSIHLISQGHDPSCVLTIREIDAERVSKSKKKTSILEDSKTGVLGRIITGLRIKIIRVAPPSSHFTLTASKNLSSDGIVSVAGELTDSPAALVSILFTLIHAYSMNTLGSLTEWMRLIAEGVDDLAVSKHSEHARSMIELIASLCDYVEPTFQYLQHLYFEGADILREETLLAEEAAEAEENLKPKLERLDSISSSDESDSAEEKEDRHSSIGGAKPSKQQQQGSKPLQGRLLPQRVFKAVSPRRRTGMTTEVQLSMASLPPGVDNLPVSFTHARLFLGGNAALHYLSLILDGDEALEVKGIKYWKERLLGLQENALKVKDDIHSSLEEKRNFFSFILTIVTVGLAPLTVLTGYWGMNFENMVELQPHTYPAVPGVTLIWVTIAVVYSIFLIMSIHYRILYSAT